MYGTNRQYLEDYKDYQIATIVLCIIAVPIAVLYFYFFNVSFQGENLQENKNVRELIAHVLWLILPALVVLCILVISFISRSKNGCGPAIEWP